MTLQDLSGQTITQENFGDAASAETFTVQASSGKLWRRSKVTSSYAEMVGIALNWWGDLSDPNCENGCSKQQDY